MIAKYREHLIVSTNRSGYRCPNYWNINKSVTENRNVFNSLKLNENSVTTILEESGYYLEFIRIFLVYEANNPWIAWFVSAFFPRCTSFFELIFHFHHRRKELLKIINFWLWQKGKLLQGINFLLHSVWIQSKGLLTSWI